MEVRQTNDREKLESKMRCSLENSHKERNL